jgi:hypothetical protein
VTAKTKQTQGPLTHSRWLPPLTSLPPSEHCNCLLLATVARYAGGTVAELRTTVVPLPSVLLVRRQVLREELGLDSQIPVLSQPKPADDRIGRQSDARCAEQQCPLWRMQGKPPIVRDSLHGVCVACNKWWHRDCLPEADQADLPDRTGAHGRPPLEALNVCCRQTLLGESYHGNCAYRTFDRASIGTF